MADIRIINHASLNGVWMDWLLAPNGLLDESMELATAVIVALGTDHLATVTDVLPDPDSTDRRGWWGDIDAETIWDGWAIGSRLWLLARAKITGAGAREGATTTRAESYANEALRPLVEKHIAKRVTAKAVRIDTQRIDMTVTLYRSPLPDIELRYEALWSEIRNQ